MAKTNSTPRAPASGPAGVVLGAQGQPAYILLEYDLYLAHQAEIDAWRSGQTANGHATQRQTLSDFTALASEEILAREWLTPTEDEAWADL